MRTWVALFIWNTEGWMYKKIFATIYAAYLDADRGTAFDK